MRSLAFVRNIPLLATAGVFLLLYAAAAARYPGFFSLKVFTDLLIEGNSFLGIIAVGMTLVIISGGIDLSVGGVMALCTVVMAVLMRHNVDPLAAMLTALVIGASMGLVTGCVIHFFRLAPFIATLAGMFFARGLALIVSPQALPIENKFYTWVTGAGLQIGPLALPIPAVIFLVMVAVGLYISVFTSFGRNLYAIGGNEDAALLMALPVGRTKILVYTFSGFCSALAAIVLTFYQPSGDPTAGVGLELDAIAVTVVGGTLLTGGAGSVFGSLIGTLIYGIIQTGIMFQGNLNSWWTKVAIGMLLLAFIVLQKFLSHSVYRRS